jgi:hypothetical protein
MKKSTATEALRVASEVAAIRAALYKRGYRIRKQPKQPIWKVFVSPDHFYLLTYQPAPISASYFPRDVENLSPARRDALNSPPSLLGKGVGGLGLPLVCPHGVKSQLSAWVLHPQNHDSRRYTIETIIQQALKKQPAVLIRRAG